MHIQIMHACMHACMYINISEYIYARAQHGGHMYTCVRHASKSDCIVKGNTTKHIHGCMAIDACTGECTQINTEYFDYAHVHQYTYPVAKH